MENHAPLRLFTFLMRPNCRVVKHKHILYIFANSLTAPPRTKRMDRKKRVSFSGPQMPRKLVRNIQLAAGATWIYSTIIG